MKAIKVNQIAQIEIQSGKVTICKGKLIFVDNTIDPNEFDYGLPFTPIIISETEEIEEGEYFVYDIGNGVLDICEYKDEDLCLYCYSHRVGSKILALPEHFTQKQLQSIVNGELKDGDEVLVECETIYPRTQPWQGRINYSRTEIKQPLILHKTEESWDDILG